MKTSLLTPNALALSLTATILACGGTAEAQDASSSQQLLDKIKKLEERVAELESKGPEAPAAKAAGWQAWLGATKFNGFASASYFYSFNRTEPITGRLYDVNHNEIELNKLKLTLEKPVEFSAENWDVGYRADLIFGQDAQKIQAGDFNLGKYGDLEQLFLTANLPVGRGLQVSAGKMVTLMGVEVVEEVTNPNLSIGNQFMFVENTTGTGLQLSYRWSDKWDTQVRLLNGWDVVKDNNTAFSYMARIGFTPDAKTTIALVPYGGPEQANNSGAWRKGIDLVVNRKLTDKLTAWVQGDYGHEDANPALPIPDKDADWWAGGLWLTYDFTDKIGVALRGDYLKDGEGARTSGAPAYAPFPFNTGQDLTSLTLTLNLKPLKNLQVRPELRWDHSSAELFGRQGGDLSHTQVTAGFGLAYLF